MADGCDVRGLLYWTLVDNFEWAFGWAPRFGLFQWEVSEPSQVCWVLTERAAQCTHLPACVACPASAGAPTPYRHAVMHGVFSMRGCTRMRCGKMLLAVHSLACNGVLQKRTERESTRTTIRRLFRELPAKVEALWQDGLRRSVKATALAVNGLKHEQQQEELLLAHA